MEVSVFSRQANAAGSDLLMLPVRSRLQLLAKQRRKSLLPSPRGLGPAGLGAAAIAGPRCRRRVLGIRAAIRSETVGQPAKKAAARRVPSRRSAVDRPELFVGLPLDAVSDCNTLNHAKAIAAGLKALRLLGVDGVELPVWWGVAEKEVMGKYDWSGYLALVQLIREAGLQIRASLYFHASAEPDIPLPQWVSAIGEADPDIFFTDRAGKRHRECLTVAVDDLPVLQGKTPMEVYGGFLQSFRTTFSDFLGSTIKDVLVGHGPDGELKYPSLPPPAKNRQAATGVGEFQCYDKNMLGQLKQHAEASGNHYWGLTGPHDAPHYNQSPDSTNFFKENGGSWESPYGNFFLSWYSERLLSHADRLLSVASAKFVDVPVTVYGKVPVVHAWYNSRSHPSELTAGFYNTAGRDGYGAVAEVFSRHSCGMILPSMDLSDGHQPRAARSSPESLLTQIMKACKKHGVPVAGENSAVRGVPDGFAKIKGTLSRRTQSPENAVVDKFTYQRMGAYFFSPEHFPLFTQFVRSLDWSDLHPDDQPAEDEENVVPLTASSAAEGSRQMQAVV